MCALPRHRVPRRSVTQGHAAEHLAFIRQAMERAGSFTAVSGWGQVAVGAVGLMGAALATRRATQDGWLLSWIGTAVVAVCVAGWAIWRKAARVGSPLLSGPGRRFALCVTPPLVAGAVLTVVFYRAGLGDRLPGLWLLLYGTGVMAGGALSIRVVPVMGACFVGLGVAALASPSTWGDWFMAGGFGLLHIIFGFVIAARYGG